MKNISLLLVFLLPLLGLSQTAEENAYAYRNRALVYFALDLEKEACKDLSIAEYYGFKLRYGNEVENLIKDRCR